MRNVTGPIGIGFSGPSGSNSSNSTIPSKKAFIRNIAFNNIRATVVAKPIDHPDIHFGVSVREVNSKGETVWEINKDDFPGFPLYTVQGLNRLANGNTVISNWGGSIRKEDWDKVVQVMEVTKDKKLVWALYQWEIPAMNYCDLLIVKTF